jgi:ribosome recycling factor
MQELFREIEIRMRGAVEHFAHELKSVRAGRASTSVLDGVTVDYYGTPTPLAQVASVTVVDATMLVAQPWDPTSIPAIEKAILQSDLGLNPSNDGRMVRIPIPSLTEERRKALVRQTHDMAETSRNSIRQARREGNDRLKKLEKDKAISQDDERRGHDEIQRLHDHYIGQVQQMLTSKETSILEL